MTELPTLESYFHRYVQESVATLEAPYFLAAFQRIVPIFLKARKEDRTIFFFGNGGSASTASHFVTDIAKVAGGTKPHGKGQRFRCVSLNDNVPSVTAWANDVSYAEIFAGPLRALAETGDVAVAISGSGNSPNVLAAVRAAREMGLTTIGLTGIGGGKLKDMVDVALIVPSNSMQHTEDVHLVTCHLLCAYLRDEQPIPD
ncbi:MAG TPA: SIS domain-containing protein [Thermoplasmata archaeon]|nr:SIS domain-containing protein [Thermoplasmata archaeon]HYB78263.1 SIS domain-containing protein [Thermoplasmata archaeon]